MKIVADANIPYVREYFQAYGDLILKPGRSISPAEVRDADLLLVRSITHVNEALLAGSKVKFVGSVTAGADHLDTKWLEQAGIAWRIAAGFNAPPVADYVACVLAVLRGKGLLPKTDVRAAVLGVGNVGRRVVKLFRLLGMEVVLCDPVRARNEKGFISTPLDQLSDFDLISIHVPLLRRSDYPTYHSINERFLQKQKPGCVLLNASRGAVIDSKALLKAGRHLHWCFDVWENEPNINLDILKEAVVATPHIAGYSIQSKIRGIDMIYQLACQQKVIPPQLIPPLEMPKQQLSFAGSNHHWEDIVLGIFNPLVITAMMRSLLVSGSHCGVLFDEMRNQFNYRHEFAATSVYCDGILQQDRELLTALEIGLSS